MDGSKIIEFAKDQGYDSASFLQKWKGYEVYEPIFEGEGVQKVGLPLVILVKKNSIRLSTQDEAFALLDES